MVLTDKDWSDTDWVSADVSLSSVSVVEDESEDSIKLLNEILNISELLIKMEEDFAVAGAGELKAVLGLDGLVVVDLCVSNDTDVTQPEWLVTTLREIVDPQAIKSKHKLLRELLELHIVRSSSVLSL